MYLGKVVETADRDDLSRHARAPLHRALLSAVPVPIRRAGRRRNANGFCAARAPAEPV
jgi:ABC-type oligopeptide transport system ATPase subunit